MLRDLPQKIALPIMSFLGSLISDYVLRGPIMGV